MPSLHRAHYESPIGWLQIAGNEQAVTAVDFVEPNDGATADPPAHIRDCLAQLDAYFRGRRTQFTLPLDPQGTDFQRQVWTHLQGIPFGATTTYAEVAAAVGRPRAVRAAGHANGRNPISIIIPCHRVLGSDGGLTGYGGGLWRKAWLLEHERTHARR